MIRIRRTLSVVAGTLLFSGPAFAQANIPQLRGEKGVLSGTLPVPGVYFGMFYSSYEPSNVITGDETAFGRMQPLVDYTALQARVTYPNHVLGGHASSAISVPWTDFAIPVPNAVGRESWGFGDLYVQPIKMGWSYPFADFVGGLGVFMPTGRFRAGATNNTGLGMWSYEMSAGSTLYLGSSKQSSFSALAAYQVQSKVKGTDAQAGQVLSVEGGLGHTILPHVGQIGLAYYADWKLTADKNFHVQAPFAGYNRTYGVGPEVTLPFPLFAAQGSVTFRYFEEFGCRSTTEGNTFLVSVHAFMP